ncbi:MAG TPA: hypothetical protein VIJ70_02460 [Gaiellaceae bacterium]
MAAATKAGQIYHTLKTQVSLGNGQHLAFQKGNGYYASSQPVPVPVDPDVKAANQSVAAQIAAALAPIRTQEGQAHTQSMLTGDQIAGYTKALAGMLAGIAPATQQTFTDAGNSQATYAKGLSGDAGAAATQDAQNLNAYIAKVGGSGTVADNGGNIANVLYGTGGMIPADQFAKQGAGFVAAAKQLPAEAAGMGQENLATNAANWAKTQQSYANQIANLEAKRPGLVQSALSSMKSQELRQQAYNAAIAKTNTTNTGTYIDPATGQAVPKVGYTVDPATGNVISQATLNAQTRASAAAAAKAAAVTAKQSAIHGKAVKARNDATAKAYDTLTQGHFDKLAGTAGAKPLYESPVIAQKIKQGASTLITYVMKNGGVSQPQNPTAPPPAGVKTTPVYGKGVKAPTLPPYQQSFNYTLRYMKTNLARFGYSAAQLVTMTHQIVDPYYPKPAPLPAPLPAQPGASPFADPVSTLPVP